jgi:prophage regulatory protein
MTAVTEKRPPGRPRKGRNSNEYDPERRRKRIVEARDRARVTVKVGELPRILRIAEVEIVTGLTRATIYEEMQAGFFPPPIPLSPRAVGWLESEIKSWIERCVSARAAGKANKEPEVA